jgi:hypothetical protein
MDVSIPLAFVHVCHWESILAYLKAQALCVVSSLEGALGLHCCTVKSQLTSRSDVADVGLHCREGRRVPILVWVLLTPDVSWLPH